MTLPSVGSSRLFRRLDTDKSNTVSVDDVVFFVRSATVKIRELGDTRFKSAAQSNEVKRGKLLLRTGRTLWEHMDKVLQDSKQAGGGGVYQICTSVLRKVDTKNTGHVSQAEFVQMFKLLQVTLTLAQEAIMFQAIDEDASGTIEHGEFLAFLAMTKKLIEQKAREDAEAQDPRNYNDLVQFILRSVSDDVDVVLPLLCLVGDRLTGVSTPVPQRN